MKPLPSQLLYTIVMVLLASCQKESISTGDLPLMELEDIELIRTPYTIVKVIPLETNENNLLGDFLTVKFSDAAFFIFDENARDAIHTFDRKGNYQGRSVETGEGPGMVANISDFIPTPEGTEILNAQGDQAKIIRFDNSGEIKGNLNLDYYGSSFTKLANGHYVASGSYNLPLVENRLAIMDGHGNTVKTFLPNTHEILPMQEKNFYTANETVFFHEIYNNTTYKVLEESLASQYQFDFGKYSIPERFFEMDWMAGFEMLNQQGFAVISQYWENEEKAFFGVDVQVNGERKNHQVILDKHNMQAGKRIISANDLNAFYHPVGVLDELLVFVAQAPAYLKLEADQLPENSPIVQEGDNPVLLFVEF
ncbi:6-bladed beta-propeller [Cyclobacterium jeungdonense]|uniref:6-bladed beta-propeller n=1 Tax=Cyclobacterium jeungdonense TaxID=708087 RepID=A0ABT8C6I4_9BACT|nr:6-bladed beta-propeller [Cyclobacterium jeungdonense]MDN3687672.1 6-bladed beta-propeller [Cyclobacterium jeungdonense]